MQPPIFRFQLKEALLSLKLNSELNLKKANLMKYYVYSLYPSESKMVLKQGFSNCGPGTARVPQWGCEGVHDKGSGKNDVFFF